MSKMKFDRKPPLAKSPIRLRPRRVVRSNTTSLQTPSGCLTKSQKRTWAIGESEIRSEYRSISCELRDLARMVKNELGNGETESAAFGKTSLSANPTPLFERGRFYDEYSARRNERLKIKKGETGTELKTGHHLGLGVTVESSKRRDSKKLDNLKKSVSTAMSVERNETQTPRYLLRSMSKLDNKKPPLAVNHYNSSVIDTEKKTAARRVRRV